MRLSDSASTRFVGIALLVLSFLTLTGPTAVLQPTFLPIAADGGATTFDVSVQSTAAAGDPVNVTVTALDGGGNVAAGYRGSVVLTSTDPSAVLPGTYTFDGGDQGRHTFAPLTFATPGPQRVTATDTTFTLSAQSATVTVSAPSGEAPVAEAVAPADDGNQADERKADERKADERRREDERQRKGAATGEDASRDQLGAASNHGSFRVSVSPNPVAPNSSATVTVTALRSDGSTDTGFNGSVRLSASGGATFSPRTPNLSNGTATATVTFDTSGNQTVTATETDNSNRSGSTTVNVSGSSSGQGRFTVTVEGSPSTNSSATVRVTAVRSDGSTDTGYTGTVRLTTSSGSISPNELTFSSGDNGQRTAMVTFTSSGSQTVTATDRDNANRSGSTTVNVSGSATTTTSFPATTTTLVGGTTTTVVGGTTTTTSPTACVLEAGQANQSVAKASPPSGPPGTKVVLTGGNCFQASQALEIFLVTAPSPPICSTGTANCELLGTVAATSSGGLNTTFEIPAGTPLGTYRIQVVGQGGTHISSTAFTVAAADTAVTTTTPASPQSDSSGTLPRTGASTGKLATAGVLAISGGWILTRGARHTSRRHVAVAPR